MDAEQLKLLRMHNQFLLSPAAPRAVVRGLIGLQAQYGAAALHALDIRSTGQRELTGFVKTWSFRGTLHLHDREDLPLVLYRGSETDFGQMSFWHDQVASGRADYFRGVILHALESGDKTRDQLKAACMQEGLNEQEAQIILHPWGGLFRAMAEKGEIAYTPDGSRVFTRLSPVEPVAEEAALSELMRRYLAHYAPVSLRDAQTFFGIPQKRLKHLLEQTAEDSFTFQNQTYFTLGQSLPQDASIPSILFLAAFDQLLLGYRKTENPILPENSIRQIYNNTGIVFPTVLLQGTAAAVWKRTGNKLELRPLKKINQRDRMKIERKAVDKFGVKAVQWTQMQR